MRRKYAKINKILSKKTLMSENLKHQVETSLSTEETKEDTKDIITKSKQILDFLREKSPELYKKAVKEYNDIKNTTKAALLNDRKITEWELGNIKREFKDMKKLDERSFWEKRGDQIARKIIKANDDVIQSWWATLDSHINEILFFTAWDTQKQIEAIRDSGENIYTKLFRMSEVMRNSWYGNFDTFISWHDKATREILKWMIHNNKEIVVIWHDSTNWYTVKTEIEFLNENKGKPIQNLKEKEIGTYMCALAARNKLSQKKLEETFWIENTIEIIQMVRSGKFAEWEREDVNKIYMEALEKNNFQGNMEDIIKKFLIKPNTNLKQIGEVVKNAISNPKNREYTEKILQDCEFCKNIENMTYDEAKNFNEEEESSKMLKKVQPEFYEAITKIKEIHEQGKQKTEEIILSGIGKEIKDEKTLNLIKETAGIVYESSIENLWKEPCAFTLKVHILSHEKLHTLKDFLKTTHGINLDLEEITQKISNITTDINIKEKQQQSKSLKQRKKQLEDIIKDQNSTVKQKKDARKKLKAIKAQIEVIQEDISEAQRISEISKNTSIEDAQEFQRLIDSWKSRKEAINEIQKANPKLQKIFKTYRWSFEKHIPVETEKINSITFIDWEYSIETETWDRIQWLSQEEINLINDKKNPEALDNLIHFYNFFKDINMLWVWKHRKDFVTAMEDRSINLEDNSLSEDELLRFWNNLIKVMNNLSDSKWEKKNNLNEQVHVSGVKNELRKYSEADSEVNDEKTFNNLWEDKFTAQLRENGIINETHWFQKEKFKKYLK